MPSTVSGTFTGKGVSASLALGNVPEEIVFTISNTFSAFWTIERAKTPDGTAWEVVYGPSNQTVSAVVQGDPNQRFRVRCTAFTSGTITYTMSDRFLTAVPRSFSGGANVAGSIFVASLDSPAPTFFTVQPSLQSAGSNTSSSMIGVSRWVASANGPTIAVGHSRGTVIGSQALVVDADSLGQYAFCGSDGNDLVQGAWIKALVTGTPASGVMPTSITFGTAVTDAAPVERMRIDPNGNVGVGFSTSLCRLSVNGAISRGVPLGKDSSFTLATDEATIIVNSATTVTVTLPAGSATPGRELWIKSVGAGTVVSKSSNVVPQAGGAAGTAILGAAGRWALLIADGTNWTIMASN